MKIGWEKDAPGKGTFYAKDLRKEPQVVQEDGEGPAGWETNEWQGH